MQPARDHIVDAADVLNDFIADLAAGTNVFRDYRTRLRDGTFLLVQFAAVQKLCISHLFLSLNKLLEFSERYRSVIPDDIGSELNKHLKRIRKSGVEDFRNKVAGHIWDRKAKRPLRQSEVNRMLEELIGQTADEFLDWLNDMDKNPYPTTVLSVVEHLRDWLMTTHGIHPDEILHR